MALLELIRHYETEAPDRVFVEALSDIVTRDFGKIIITQAKRTLSSGALSKALDELWSIDCLAQNIASEVANQFVCRIAAARQVLRDWEGARDRWTATDDADLEALARFKARISCLCIPNPRLEAAHLLVLQFKDQTPLERTDKFVGKLIAAAKDFSFEDATAEIAIELKGLRNAAERQERKF